MLNDIWVYKKTSKVLMVVLLAAVILLATQNWQLGLLLFIVVAAVIVWMKRSDMMQEKLLIGYLDHLSSGVTTGTAYAIKNLPMGIAVMDEKKKLVWANSVFRSWISDADEAVPFRELIQGQRVSKIWGKTGWFDCYAKGILFRVFHKFILPEDGSETPLMVLYFMDRSDVEKTVKEAEESRPVFCLIRIDNAQEVTVDMTDVDRSALLSDVAERVLSYFSDYHGFIKQYSTSEFVACISSEALQEMMDGNFEILDKVRDIHTVNRIPVTLSIGIVKSEDTFAKQYEEAQVSLDLALGRGGDQVIVRLGKDVKAFGGKAPTSVSGTRVRVRVVAQALKEVIQEADQVLVMGHAHEDFDALGAAVGVTHLARLSHVDAHIILSSQDDTSKKMIDAIRTSGMADGLLIDENQAKGFLTDKTVVIVVDTHVPTLVAAPEILKKAKKRVVIDHHRRSSTMIETPLLTYMEPSASSASELVTELIQYYGGDEEMNVMEASCLYAGIVVDTKNFAVQTSVRTFDAASYLRRCGADTALVNRLFAVDMNFIKVKSEILSKLTQVDEYMVFAECPEGTVDSQIIAGQVADFLVTVQTVRCSFIFYHTEKGLCLSARSNGTINVQVVMEAVGGGGHQTVAGAQFGEEGNIKEITKAIIQEVRKQMEEEKE